MYVAPLARLNTRSNANTPLPTPWTDISIYRVRMRQLRQKQKEKRRLTQDPCYIIEDITREDYMVSERRTGEARGSLPIHQHNVSQSYIYQTPLVHDSPASSAQSSIEDLVPQTIHKLTYTHRIVDPPQRQNKLIKHLNTLRNVGGSRTHRMLSLSLRCSHADIHKEHDSLKCPPGEQALSKNDGERQCTSNFEFDTGFCESCTAP